MSKECGDVGKRSNDANGRSWGKQDYFTYLSFPGQLDPPDDAIRVGDKAQTLNSSDIGQLCDGQRTE